MFRKEQAPVGEALEKFEEKGYDLKDVKELADLIGKL